MMQMTLFPLFEMENLQNSVLVTPVWFWNAQHKSAILGIKDIWAWSTTLHQVCINIQQVGTVMSCTVHHRVNAKESMQKTNWPSCKFCILLQSQCRDKKHQWFWMIALKFHNDSAAKIHAKSWCSWQQSMQKVDAVCKDPMQKIEAVWMAHQKLLLCKKSLQTWCTGNAQSILIIFQTLCKVDGSKLALFANQKEKQKSVTC